MACAFVQTSSALLLCFALLCFALLLHDCAKNLQKKNFAASRYDGHASFLYKFFVRVLLAVLKRCTGWPKKPAHFHLLDVKLIQLCKNSTEFYNF